MNELRSSLGQIGKANVSSICYTLSEVLGEAMDKGASNSSVLLATAATLHTLMDMAGLSHIDEVFDDGTRINVTRFVAPDDGNFDIDKRH